MAEFKTNVMRMLDKEKVPYTPHTYDHGDGAIDGASVAAKMGQDPARVFKTLVTQGAGKSYFVFVVPVLAELDLKKAAKSVGEKSVAMLHVADINKVTGYVRGGCSPLGMKKAYRTVFDRSALAGASIIVSGGRIRLSDRACARGTNPPGAGGYGGYHLRLTAPVPHCKICVRQSTKKAARRHKVLVVFSENSRRRRKAIAFIPVS